MPTILDVLQGKARVIAFVSKRLHKYWGGHRWVIVDINGARGFILKYNGETVATVSFGYDEAGKATDIYIVRDPDKLANLGAVAIH